MRAGPAKMIGRAFYSTTASTDYIFIYRDVKSIPWNITKSVSRSGFSNLPTPPLMLEYVSYNITIDLNQEKAQSHRIRMYTHTAHWFHQLDLS